MNDSTAAPTGSGRESVNGKPGRFVAKKEEAGLAELSVTNQDDDEILAMTTAGGQDRGLPLKEAPTATVANTQDEEIAASQQQSQTFLGTIIRALAWTPRTCRYDPANPPDFTFGLNLLFSFVGLFSRIKSVLTLIAFVN